MQTSTWKRLDVNISHSLIPPATGNAASCVTYDRNLFRSDILRGFDRCDTTCQEIRKNNTIIFQQKQQTHRMRDEENRKREEMQNETARSAQMVCLLFSSLDAHGRHVPYDVLPASDCSCLPGIVFVSKWAGHEFSLAAYTRIIRHESPNSADIHWSNSKLLPQPICISTPSLLFSRFCTRGTFPNPQQTRHKKSILLAFF